MKHLLKIVASALVCGTVLTGAVHAETPKEAVSSAAGTVKKQTGNAMGTGSRSLKRFEKFDKSADQKISKSEFQAAYDVMFMKKDKNKDGFLDKAEFSPTLSKMKR